MDFTSEDNKFKLISLLDKIIKEGWDIIPPFFNFTNISYFYPNYEINLIFGNCCTISSNNINSIRNYKLTRDEYDLFYNKYNNYIYNLRFENIKPDDYIEEYLKSLIYIAYGFLNNPEIEIKDILREVKKVLYNSFYNIVINIPELTITNSRKLSHLMRGIYLNLNFEGFILKYVSLARNIYTTGELNNKYRYSHIHKFSSDDIYKYNPNFCYSTNTLIPSALTAYNDEVRNYNKKHYRDFRILKKFKHLEDHKLSFYLQNYLICFINYLSWESLEGGPYTKLANNSSKNFNFYKNLRVYKDFKNPIFNNEYFHQIKPSIKILFEEMLNYFIYNNILTFSVSHKNRIVISNNRKDLINYCYAYLKINNEYLLNTNNKGFIVFYKTDENDNFIYALNEFENFEHSNPFSNSTSNIYFNNTFAKGELFKENLETDFLETIHPSIFENFMDFTEIKLLEYLFIKQNNTNPVSKKTLILSLND